MKKLLALILCLVLTAGLFACSAKTEPAAQPAAPEASTDTAQTEQPAEDTAEEAPEISVKAVNIATASMGGAYYPLGVGVSEIFAKVFPGLEARVEVTGGTVENPGLVNAGDCEIGIANTDMALFAYEGQTPFEEPYPNLRGWIGGVAGGVVHYCVLESSGIKTLEDLIGKKIAVGPQGNSTSLFLEKVLTVMGYSWDDIQPSYLGFSDGVQALIDGKVDMAIVSAYPPVSAVQELAASGKAFNLIPFDDEFRAKFLEAYPYYKEFTVSKDIYGLSEDVTTVSTENMFMINADLDDDTVYLMTKAVMENLDMLKTAATSAGTITTENAPETGIPLHPGAERYYREIGALGE